MFNVCPVAVCHRIFFVRQKILIYIYKVVYLSCVINHKTYKQMTDFYTTEIDKAVKFAELNCAGLYMITNYICDCGNQTAKKLTCHDFVIYICPCSDYAIKSKQL